MKKVYLELLKENQLLNLPTSRPREFTYHPIPQTALVLIGARRVGKTMLAKRVALNLLEKGVSRENILYLNFFDERLENAKSGDLGLILEAYYELHPSVTREEEKHFFFDEIQVIPGWERFVSRLLNEKQNKVYLTGSSAHLLSKEIATEMRGRALSQEIFPLSFTEFLAWSNVSTSSTSAKERGNLSATFNRYFVSGGFPATFELDTLTATRLLQEYYTVAIYKDVIERNKAKKPVLIDALAKLLLSQVASPYTLNKLLNKLRSQGFKTSSVELSEYITWLEDAYLLYSIPIYSESEQKKRVNPLKVYCIDHALLKAVSASFLDNAGHLLENVVFMELRRKYEHISYFKTEENLEADFVYKDRSNALVVVQVSLTINNDRTRTRELKSLRAAVKELKADKAYLVTLGEREEITDDGFVVEVVPACEFVLGC